MPIPLPLAGWTPIATGVFGPDRSFSFTVPVITTNAQQFFQVRVP